MNYKMLGKILGKIMILEGALMIAPLITSLIYRESFIFQLSYLIPIALLLGIGMLLQVPKPKRQTFYQKEGFALVALAWIVMTLFGALPFVINGDIPNYIDAYFEIMSGFTTTGASIVSDITLLSHSTLFWRSFSHWIGGMGVLVFVLIFIPESKDGSAMHLLRAESPGPQVGKIVSKMKVTTRILYLIYMGLTVLQVILLSCDKPIPGYEGDHFFISLLTTFGSAGTGGFGVIPNSLELYNPFSQYVTAIFLLLYGCNFALYYLLLIGKVKEVFKSEELRTYLIIIISAVAIVFCSLLTQGGAQNYTGEEAFRHSLFQVASILTTTGYSTTDFALWPMLPTTILTILMLCGAMAGSTAGGLKTSRIVIALKGVYIHVRKLINPRYVPKAKFDGKLLEQKTINDVFAYITLFTFVFVGAIFILAFDPACGSTVTMSTDAVINGAKETSVTHGFFTNFSAVLACISNIGPGFEAVGPYGSYAAYSGLSKIVLTFTMLMGRLEILPVFVLFNPKTWKKI